MDIAVGVLLAVAGLVLVGLAVVLAARRGPPSSVAPPAADQVDDLPHFFEFPPGSAAATQPASDTVVALAPAPRPVTPTEPRPRRSVPTAALAVLAGLVVLLVAAAVVASADGDDRRGPAEGDGGRGPDGITAGDGARLRFGGIVLEEHAVGVTVTYPVLLLDAGADGPVVSLELPAWNCFAADAPENPAGAGCVTARTEYAEPDSSDLSVTRDGNRLRIAGDVATTRRAGGDVEPTGRTYDLAVTVEPTSTATPGRWVPASGLLQFGNRSTSLLEGRLRFHD